MSGPEDESPIVSFTRARKARLHASAKAQADANAVKFGRTKAERVLDASQGAAARKKLDQHQMDDE